MTSSLYNLIFSLKLNQPPENQQSTKNTYVFETEIVIITKKKLWI